MAKESIDSIYQELSGEEGIERDKVLSVLRTRVAGGLEIQHRGHDAEDYWTSLNLDLESVVENSPQDAFEFALDTLALDEAKDDSDKYRSWLKGNALIIL